jgi:hypothetical protein
VIRVTLNLHDIKGTPDDIDMIETTIMPLMARKKLKMSNILNDYEIEKVKSLVKSEDAS